MQPDTPDDFAPRFPGSGRLQGRLALITGGTSGIGRAVAELFAREGARLVLTCLEEDEAARTLIARLHEAGAEAHLLVLDVRDREACHAAAARAAAHGPLDVLICNAAIQRVVPEVAELNEGGVGDTLSTNIEGYLWMVQAARPHLAPQASVILTTSALAYLGSATMVDYAASKAAGVGLVRSLALQLAPEGIRVNGVAPGPVRTPLVAETLPEDELARFGLDVPLGRPAVPSEIAPSFLFLACADGAYMTGQVLHPNGGLQVGS